MAIQSFFVHGRFLGSREVPNFRQDACFGSRPTESFAYFCHHCGDIWARFLVTPGGFTQCFHHSCEKHGGGELACDSRWEWLPVAFDDSWPLDAMRWEFDQLVRRAERAHN